jgi:hypothetical protein
VTDKLPEQHVHKSTCPSCGKFLTRPMVRIENVSLTEEAYNELRRGVKIRYGAQTKCRNCKTIKSTEAAA